MKSTAGSDMDVHFDKEAKPGVSNLHTIYSQLNNVDIEDFESKYKGAGYGT